MKKSYGINCITKVIIIIIIIIIFSTEYIETTLLSISISKNEGQKEKYKIFFL